MRGAILPDTESASTLDLNILALELRNIYIYIFYLEVFCYLDWMDFGLWQADWWGGS